MDGTVINPWYGLFPPQWADGLGPGEGDDHRLGEVWERRRRALQRLGDCCIRMCADMWSSACFFWTAPNRAVQAADRSRRGRAWAAEASDLPPERLKQEMRVFKMAWESKRQTTYARWVRAAWSNIQWWVEQKKEAATRNRSKGRSVHRNRRGDWLTPGGGNDPGG